MNNTLLENALVEDLYRQELFDNNFNDTIKNKNLDDNLDDKSENYDHTLDYIGLGCISIVMLCLFYTCFLVNIYYPIKDKGLFNFIKENCYCCCYCCCCSYFNNNIPDTQYYSSSDDEDNYSLYNYPTKRIDVYDIININKLDEIVVIENNNNKTNIDETNIDETNTCSICLNNFNEIDDDNIIKLKCCRQKFCKYPCLESWITEKYNSNENGNEVSCPLCRKNLIIQ